MYLRRKIDSFLETWKNAVHKPLIVKGARQIGKTESIRRFATQAYDSFIEINFIEEPKYRTITSDGYKAEDVVRNISLIDPGKKFIPGKTLLFFDELQDFPEIATALKFFAEDGRYDVICSGSMLGINYRKIESNSVGYKTDYIMRSMDFEEFLWAKGYEDRLVASMLKHMLMFQPFSQTELSVLEGLFLDYSILGGMPAVVRKYIETGIFSETLAIQRQLIEDYKEDIRKYAEGMDQTRIVNVFDHIPVQLAKDNKKFQLSKVASGARYKDYRGCIEWLRDAGLVNVCYCMHFPELPLKGNYDADKFKLYYFDSGMLVAMLDDEAQEDLRANKNLGVYKGALYENIVSEALVKSGCELYYYKRENSTLEEDFFLRSAKCLIPVEVKAANARAKSLRTLIESDKYEDIAYGIKLIKGNIGNENRIITFPYFCTFLLKKFIKDFDGEDK